MKLEDKDKNKSLVWAAGNGHLEVCRFLVTCGVDVGAGDDRALKCVMGNGHDDVVEFLKSCK